MFPIRAAWRMATMTCNRLGIVATLVIGLVLMGLGYFLTASLLGAILGVPTFVAGLFLTARAMY